MGNHKSSKSNLVPEPESGLNFIDVHCHIPFPLENSTLPPWETQIKEFLSSGGICMISSSIDLETLQMMHIAAKNQKNLYYTCGWAPQTVTFTKKEQYQKDKEQWRDFIKSNNDFLAIGEIGLDFHHAKTLEERNRQISELKIVLKETIGFQKPYVFHVRNAGLNDFDKMHNDHPFNSPDAANQEIIKILKEFQIEPSRCMWHCFSGPEEWGPQLSNQGFTLSVPSSAYGNNKWRRNTNNVPLEHLVTETDAVFQHPFKPGPVNVPKNVTYSIAAIAYSHNISQQEVAEQTIKNAEKFFGKKF
jgi:TatD DNase family protein